MENIKYKLLEKLKPSKKCNFAQAMLWVAFHEKPLPYSISDTFYPEKRNLDDEEELKKLALAMEAIQIALINKDLFCYGVREKCRTSEKQKKNYTYFEDLDYYAKTKKSMYVYKPNVIIPVSLWEKYYVDNSLRFTPSEYLWEIDDKFKLVKYYDPEFNFSALEQLFPLSSNVLDSEHKHKAKLKTLKSKAISTTNLHPKEKITLLKIILGLTLTNYPYNPLANRNSTAREITDDLLNQGISVNEDTVLKWLNEAKEYLPADWGKNS